MKIFEFPPQSIFFYLINLPWCTSELNSSPLPQRKLAPNGTGACGLQFQTFQWQPNTTAVLPKISYKNMVMAWGTSFQIRRFLCGGWYCAIPQPHDFLLNLCQSVFCLYRNNWGVYSRSWTLFHTSRQILLSSLIHGKHEKIRCPIQYTLVREHKKHEKACGLLFLAGVCVGCLGWT